MHREALLLLTFATAGCALTSKGEAVQPRFYSAEVAAPARTGGAGATGSCDLRLGGVDAAAHLRERMVFRQPSGEVGFYEERRWTERPEVYARRALSRALFEQKGLREVVAGEAPTLSVELLAFEEVRRDDGSAVRLRLAAELSDDRTVVWRQTFAAEKALPGKSDDERAGAIAAALAQCLQEVAAAVAESTVKELPKVAGTAGGTAACAVAER